jgi:hypothetical protein
MRSRVAVAGLVAVATLVVLRIGVAPAETCPPVSAADTRAAAQDAVEWFAANQRADGSFAYLIDESGEELGGYNVTRHAGVLMSLYQAASAGIDDALAVADRGLDWARDRLEPAGGGRALGNGTSTLPTGASALLLAAVDERRNALPDDETDELARDLATFLAATVEPSGAVLASWDTSADRPVPGAYSLYFTGETMWALARIGHPAADAIAGYMPGRDEEEDLFPPTPDHWAAYGWAELAAAGRPLTEEQLDHARRLVDIFGVEVRVESTRWSAEGPAGWLRRGAASGSGLGTIGEGTAALLRLFGTDNDGGDALARRVSCVAGMLVERQADGPGPEQRGAWFSRGVTRMDDQQHALSALLAAEPALAVAGAGSGSDPVGGGEEEWGFAVVALALLAAANPARQSQPRGSARLGVVAAYAAVVLLAALSGPIADLLSLSPASVRLAAGAVLAVTSLAGLAAPTGEWSDGLAVAATAVVALAAGVDNGVVTVAAAGLPAVAAALWLPPAWRRLLLARLVAAVGVAVAISLLVDGVLGV